MVTKKAQEASTIIVWCIVLMGLTLLIGVVAGEVRVKPVESTITQDTVIMSPRDFQALLNRLEPSQAIEEDGRIGAKTVEKWERVYGNQSAERTFER